MLWLAHPTSPLGCSHAPLRSCDELGTVTGEIKLKGVRYWGGLVRIKVQWFAISTAHLAEYYSPPVNKERCAR